MRNVRLRIVNNIHHSTCHPAIFGYATHTAGPATGHSTWLV